jgi:hypothetical protein
VNYHENDTVLRGDNVQSGVASIALDTKFGDSQIIVTPGANYKLTQEDVRQKIMDAKPIEILPHSFPLEES